ncbi:MAG TPA: N-acetylmuramoyl-L-alanine amidase [Chthoniobacterales bacterium]|nr:N-acetylmuramoyl-L-alanine amidase [Chthoniobacterales bacterium]
MNTRNKKYRKRFLFSLVLACLASAAVAFGGDWTVIRQRDRSYVTFSNVAQFYQFPDYTRVSRTVSLRSERRAIRAQAGTSELSINGVRFFTNFPLLGSKDDDLISVMDVSKILEPVLRPSRIHKAERIETVVLDPGHGGTDQGASSRWGTEKGFALDVALAARKELIRAGYRVEMTRVNDVGVSLEDRVNFANGFQRAVFVSIHFNSASGGSGVESYALAPEGVPSHASNNGHHTSGAGTERLAGNALDGQNIALTASIHAAVLSGVSTFDRGVRHARFHVLKDIKIPAVLLEAGFISDPAEGQRIATTYYRQRLGVAIAQGIQNYNAAVNYRAGAANFAVAKAKLPPHARSITDPLGTDKPLEPANHHPPSISINASE